MRLKVARYDSANHVATYSGANNVANVQKPVIDNTYTFSVGQATFSFLLTGTDRLSNFVSSADPTLNIKDTDILVFNINTDSPSKPFSLSTTSTSTVVPPTKHTLLNNNINSGVLKWYPGVGNTGTFYYRCPSDTNFKGTINVSASTDHTFYVSGVSLSPSSSNLTGTVNDTFYNAMTVSNVEDLVYTWSLSGDTGNITGTPYGSKYRLETTNNTGLATQTETFYVNVSVSSARTSETVTNSGIVILTHTSG